MGEPNPPNQAKAIDRRDFLKISGMGIAGAFLNPTFRKIESWFLPTRESVGLESANKITFRKDGVMEIGRVDGKESKRPFFPLALFYLPGPECPESWQKLKDAGFNTLSQWSVDKQETIENAEKYETKIMAFLPNIIKDGEVGIEKLTRLIASKEFIGYLEDEPSISFDKNLYLELWRGIERLDPNHPVLSVFFERPQVMGDGSFPVGEYKKNYQGDPKDLINLPESMTYNEFISWYLENSHSDIASFDYGYAPDINNDVTYEYQTEKYVENLRSGNFGPSVKAVWVTLSAHSEVPRTLKSMRFQTLDVIAHGATGILWWDWPPGCEPQVCSGYPGKGKAYSEHWDKLKSIGRELASVNEGLIGQEIFLGDNNSGDVSYKITKSESGKHYIFSASNSGTRSISTKKMIKTSLPNTYFQVVGENRVVASDRVGNLLDNFGYQDAHIYIQSKNSIEIV